MRILNLNTLLDGISGITPIFGKFLWEAVVFCFIKMEHDSGVSLEIIGHKEENIKIKWEGELEEDTKKTWNDDQELTEYAATAIALLLVLKLTNYTHFKRAQKGTRGDYWLGYLDTNNLLILDGLLEISGILRVNKTNTLQKRFHSKKIQVELSNYKSVDKNIIVVEFSTPAAKVKLK